MMPGRPPPPSCPAPARNPRPSNPPPPASAHDAGAASTPEQPSESGVTVRDPQSDRLNPPSKKVSAAPPAGVSAATRGDAGEAAERPASQSAGAQTDGAATTHDRTAPALPKTPPVYFECTGEPDVCGALSGAFERALERDGLPHAAHPDRAEVVVSARATLLDTSQNEQFGASFAVQTFSLQVQGESTRDGTPISMPPAKTFSFDRRFGRERAAEQGRLMADDAVERIQKFWTTRIGG